MDEPVTMKHIFIWILAGFGGWYGYIIWHKYIKKDL